MKSLIIGKGQVGSALYEVIKDHHDTYIRDIEELDVLGVEVLHICYPDHEGFETTTKRYIAQYKPKITVINSSVTVGTTEKCGDRVIYSPVRGRHPKLAQDMKLYAKFVFGSNMKDRHEIGHYFTKCGIQVVLGDDVVAGELLKLLSNIHMGLEIAWRQEVGRILESFTVNDNIYEEWERTYREGYKKSGDEHLMRPSMKPDPIGGHCILPCTDILSAQYPSKIFDFIKESNAEALQEYAANNGQLREIA